MSYLKKRLAEQLKDPEFRKFWDETEAWYEKERRKVYHNAYEQGKFDTNMAVWYEVPALKEELETYKEALQFYAIENHTEWIQEHGVLKEIVVDRGNKALEALEKYK